MDGTEIRMRYAFLCYDSDAVVGAWTSKQEDDVLAKHAAIEKELADQGRLGPNLSLMPTSAAVTIRSGGEPIVMDGPFAETKEQLLGFWIVDCASLEDAIQTARRFASHKQTGAIEIRPVALRDQETT
jgi:hypothetical protein